MGYSRVIDFRAPPYPYVGFMPKKRILEWKQALVTTQRSTVVTRAAIPATARVCGGFFGVTVGLSVLDTAAIERF